MRTCSCSLASCFCIQTDQGADAVRVHHGVVDQEQHYGAPKVIVDEAASQSGALYGPCQDAVTTHAYDLGKAQVVFDGFTVAQVHEDVCHTARQPDRRIQIADTAAAGDAHEPLLLLQATLVDAFEPGRVHEARHVIQGQKVTHKG